jgi:hypothetical protein
VVNGHRDEGRSDRLHDLENWHFLDSAPIDSARKLHNEKQNASRRGD